MPVYVIWWTQEECVIHYIEEASDEDIKKLEALADKCINVDDTDPDLANWICEYLQDKPKVETPLTLDCTIFKIGFAL